MEALIQNIPVAAALVLPVVLVLMVVTNIIVEVLKKLTWGKLPTNLLAFAVAMAVTLLAFFAACQIAGAAVTWYMVRAPLRGREPAANAPLLPALLHLVHGLLPGVHGPAGGGLPPPVPVLPAGQGGQRRQRQHYMRAPLWQSRYTWTKC